MNNFESEDIVFMERGRIAERVPRLLNDIGKSPFELILTTVSRWWIGINVFSTKAATKQHPIKQDKWPIATSLTNPQVIPVWEISPCQFPCCLWHHYGVNDNCQTFGISRDVNTRC